MNFKNNFYFDDSNSNSDSDSESESELFFSDNLNNKDKEDKLKTNLETEFYWEDLNQQYHFNPNLKYCIYFKGCCCPPHKGHIKSIKDVVKKFPGCKLIVNQIGSANRHGTPTEFNSELLQKYLGICIKDTKYKYMLKASSKEVYKHRYVIDSDILIIIRGDEIKTNTINKKYLVEIINKDREKSLQKHIKFLNNHKVKVVWYISKRNVNKISATKFMEILNIYKNKILNGEQTQKDLYKVMKFIPDELNYNEKKKIINQLIKYKTWSKK